MVIELWVRCGDCHNSNAAAELETRLGFYNALNQGVVKNDRGVSILSIKVYYEGCNRLLNSKSGGIRDVINLRF
jgi:hypothetical protein